MSEKAPSPIEDWHGPQLREAIEPFELHNQGETLDSNGSLYASEEIGLMSQSPDGRKNSVIGEVGINNGTDGVENAQFAVIKVTNEDGTESFALGGLMTDDSGRKVLNDAWLPLNNKEPVTFGRAAENPENTDEHLVSAGKLWPGRSFLESTGFSRNHLHVALVDGKVEIRDTSTYGSEIRKPVAKESNPAEINDDSTTKSKAEKLIQAQLDSKEEWVQHKIDIDSTPTEEVQIVQEEIMSEPEVAENSDASLKEATAEKVDTLETSESMRQSFDAITDKLGSLSGEIGPLTDKIVDSPKEFVAQVDEFLRTLDSNFSGLGDSIRTIKNLLNGVDTGFMFDLKMNPDQPISNSDIQAVTNMHNVISRITTELQTLNKNVEQTQQEGTFAQTELSEKVGGQINDIVIGVDDFVHGDVRDVKIAIDETGSELTEKALAQNETNGPESIVDGDAKHMDKLTHISGNLSVESNYLLDDAESANRMVSSKISLNSQDFTRNILNNSQLHPRIIGELTTDLQAVVSKLEMVSQMRGTKGSLHAEIGLGLKQTIERAFDQISRFRQPSTDNPDMQSDIGNAQRHVKEMASTAERFTGVLQTLASESKTNN